MDELAIEFLMQLLRIPSPTGFEAEGQRFWMDYMRPVSDAVESDAYGTAWAQLAGEGPRIMFASHADEIGFIVKRITKEGFGLRDCAWTPAEHSRRQRASEGVGG